MARFEYRADDGTMIEIDLSVSKDGAPSPLVVVLEGKGWARANDEAEAERIAKKNGGGKVFKRHFSVPHCHFPHGQAGRERVQKGLGRLPTSVDRHGNPISHTLPRRPVDPRICKQGPNGTWEHQDGEITNAGGQPVLMSERALQRVLDRTGMVHEPTTFDAKTEVKPVGVAKSM